MAPFVLAFHANNTKFPGAHTGCFNGRSTTCRLGLTTAIGPKVTPPKKRKLLGFGPLFFGWAPIFYLFIFFIFPTFYLVWEGHRPVCPPLICALARATPIKNIKKIAYWYFGILTKRVFETKMTTFVSWYKPECCLLFALHNISNNRYVPMFEYRGNANVWLTTFTVK